MVCPWLWAAASLGAVLCRRVIGTLLCLGNVSEASPSVLPRTLLCHLLYLEHLTCP